MSEVKHTPGPWITFQPRGDGSIPVRTDGLGLTICYVHDGAICDASANARLIAAAPDLLEALYDAEEYFDNRADADHDETGFVPNKEMKLLVSIRAAIAKATGK